jgi:glycosidase
VSRQFWSAWHAGLRKIYPRLSTIGEVFHPDPSVTSFFVGGQRRADGIDSGVGTVFDYPMYFAMRDVLLRGAPVGRLADVLRHDSLYQRSDDLVTFFANHDVARFASAVGSSMSKQKLAFGLVLTLRGIPQLYYGDEIGMGGGDDPENRHDFPGGWTEDSRNAFETTGRSLEQQALFSEVQSLLRLRREHPALANGRLWHLESDDTTYIFLRQTEEDNAVVALNAAPRSREIQIPLADTPAKGLLAVTQLFGDAKAAFSGQELRLKMPAESISVFGLN